MSKQPAKTPPRRLGLYLPWAAFVLIAGLYFAYWLNAAERAKAGLAAFTAAENGKGAVASVGAVSVDGFPFRLSLRLTDVSYAPPGQAWMARAPAASMHVNPTDPRHVIATLDGPLTIQVAKTGEEMTAVAPRAAASLSTRAGALKRFSLDLAGLEVQRGVATVSRADSALIHVRPDPSDATAYQVAVAVKGVRLDKPVAGFEALGRQIAELDAALVAEKASGGDLEAWRAAGGAARVEAIKVDWGTLIARGSGQLSLAAKPSGALDLVLEKPALGLAPGPHTISLPLPAAMP
jgi:hypothetical protein